MVLAPSAPILIRVNFNTYASISSTIASLKAELLPPIWQSVSINPSMIDFHTIAITFHIDDFRQAQEGGASFRRKLL